MAIFSFLKKKESVILEILVIINKQSDAWSPVYGTVYEKVDGAWIEGSMDSLLANESIIVKEIN